MNNKDATIFFPTRNRPLVLDKTLNSIGSFVPGCKVFVGNCSSKDNIKETSDVVSRYNFAEEIVFYPDPGMGDVFTILFDKIETKFAICYADDVFFLTEIGDLLNLFDNEDINVVALPMMDNTSNAPSIAKPWPTDNFGCVLWQGPNGRCANHWIVRVSAFKDHGSFFGPGHNIDNYFYNNSSQNQRIYPENGAYLYHMRYDDDTRINSVISGDRFRFPIGHPLRKGSTLMKAIEREKKEK